MSAISSTAILSASDQLPKADRLERAAALGITILFSAAVIASLAVASTDATFNTPVTWLNNALTGSLGKTLALSALAAGLGIGVVKQSVMSVVVGTAIALAASVGPGVLTGMLGAVL